MANVDKNEEQQWTDLFKRQSHLEAEVTGLKRGQDSLQSTLIEFSQEVKSELRGLRTELNKPVPATNWIGIGGLILSAMSVMGALFLFSLSPVKQDTRDTKLHMREINEVIFKHESRLSKTETLAEQLDLRIEDIDKGGSRKWIENSNVRP